MSESLSIDDFIKKIIVNEANFDYIKSHPEKKINGTLYESISKILKEYADQEKKKEAIAVIEWFCNEALEHLTNRIQISSTSIKYEYKPKEQLYDLYKQSK